MANKEKKKKIKLRGVQILTIVLSALMLLGTVALVIAGFMSL